MLIQHYEKCPAPAEHPWYALKIRANHERVVGLHLIDRGYEQFSPSYKTEAKWSDRKKCTERFLFPGYVFCRLHAQDRLPVLTVPGVVGVIGFGSGPVAVPDTEIARIRTLVNSGFLVTPWPYLSVGERVLIERGPLAGVEGILHAIKGRARIVVSIPMLQRSVSSEVERCWVRPLAVAQPRGLVK